MQGENAMPKQRAPIDYDHYRELQNQGLSLRQSAKALGIPESTLRDNLKVLQKGQQRPPEVDLGPQQSQEQQEGITVAAHTLSHAAESPPKDHQGTPTLATRPPEVDLGPHLSEIVAAWPEVHTMLTWWRHRHREVHDAEAPKHKLARQTYHVEQRFIDAIKREADLERTTIAEVVNRAFHQYFVGRET